MISYPNQRIVTVNRKMPNKTKDKKPFITIYCSAVDQASRNLKGQVAFKLWLYLAGNTDGYTEAFSPQAIKDRFGVSLDGARDAFKQLVQKKYLVLEEGTKNRYMFFEKPKSNLSAVEIRKRFENDDGVEVHLTYKELLEELSYDRDQANDLWATAQIIK